MQSTRFLASLGAAVILALGLIAPATNAQDKVTPPAPPAVKDSPATTPAATPTPPPAAIPGRQLTPNSGPLPPRTKPITVVDPAAALMEQVIVASPEIIELGTFSTTESEEGVVTLKNTSDEPVTIRSAKASCGCTTADFQRNTVLGPGESTDVKISMRGGPTARILKKTVTFTIDGYPQLKVPIQGESVAFVKMIPDKVGIDANPDGKIVLEAIDGQPFKVIRTLPDVLTEPVTGSKARHEVQIDWDKWWKNAENAKLTFYIEGHPRCNQYFTVVNLNREQRAEIQRRIREKRGKRGPKGPPTTTPSPVREADAATLVRQGRLQELTKRIQEGKVEVDQRDSSGMTLLGLAAKHGNTAAMTMLLEAGAGVDATDRVQRTPLMHAGTSKNPQALQILIEAGANVNARDLVIGGPLAWSAGFGNAQCVQILIDEGAELETLGMATGYTPLIWAAGFGDEDSIPILLEAGANMNIRDSVDRATPLLHAARTGKVAGLKSLLDAGADIEVKDRNGKTPLLVACEHSGGTVEKIQLLLSNGASLTVTDSSGKGPLDLARSRSDANAAEVIAFLEEKTGDKKE